MYNIYILTLMTIGYTLAELGRYLIGTTSKAVAQDLHYGEKSCQLNASKIFHPSDYLIKCDNVYDQLNCESLEHNGTFFCEWNYNGRGLEYQILAGPAFIAMYTTAGIVMGIIADKTNRSRLLTACTCLLAIAISLAGTVKEYWQLVILRMMMATGEAGYIPLANGILSDVFSTEKRGLAMSIFNWGVIAGYGIAFPVGRYIPDLNLWDQGWRVAYYGTGVVTAVLAILFIVTLKEPPKKVIGEEVNNKEASDEVTLWKTFKQPRLILFCLAASIRQCGGLTFAYNLDLYYRKYFPEVDMSWWLFGVTTATGMVGIVVGGFISDKFVKKMGVKSRVATLAISQTIATVPAFGAVLFEPMWAMVSLGVSFFFCVMWFGITFTVVVEIVPLKLRSTVLGIFVFVMNNIGGNLPIAVEPVSKIIGYREAIIIFYCGGFGLGALLFFLSMFVIEKPQKKPSTVTDGRDNPAYIADLPDKTGLDK